MKKGY